LVFQVRREATACQRHQHLGVVLLHAVQPAFLISPPEVQRPWASRLDREGLARRSTSADLRKGALRQQLLRRLLRLLLRLRRQRRLLRHACVAAVLRRVLAAGAVAAPAALCGKLLLGHHKGLCRQHAVHARAWRVMPADPGVCKQQHSFSPCEEEAAGSTLAWALHTPPWGKGGGAGTWQQATIQRSQRRPRVSRPAWPTAPVVAAAAAASSASDVRLRPGGTVGPNEADNVYAGGAHCATRPFPLLSKAQIEKACALCAQIIIHNDYNGTAPCAEAGRVSASGGAGRACEAGVGKAAEQGQPATPPTRGRLLGRHHKQRQAPHYCAR
jgi:hypothetical protein